MAGRVFLTLQRGRPHVGDPESHGDGGSGQGDQGRAVGAGVDGHLEDGPHAGINLVDGDQQGWIVDLDQALDAGVNGLEKRSFRGRGGSRDGDGGDVEDLEPPVPADGLRPLEYRGGVLAGAVVAAGDGDVGLLPRDGVEFLKERGEGTDLVERVGVEEGIDLLRVHGSPLSDVTCG